uniref:Putative replicase n=1 Tax=Ditsystermes virus TaxID=2796587 RepID=A0A7T7GUY8_9VIRU|nr:putative replicase [Ditsystermes virus]
MQSKASASRNSGKSASDVAGRSSSTERRVRAVLRDCERRGWIASYGAWKRGTSNLNRMARGSRQDLRSSFFMSKRSAEGAERSWVPRNVVLKQWKEASSQIAWGSLSPHYQEQIQLLEAENAENFPYPQSIFPPWAEDGEEKVQAVYSDKPRKSSLNSTAFAKAVNDLRSWLAPGSIRVSSFAQAISGIRVGDKTASMYEQGMDHGTNSGLPYLKSPWKPSPTQKPGDYQESEAAFKYIMLRVDYLMAEWKKGRVPEIHSITFQRLVAKKDIMKQRRIVDGIEKAEPVCWKTFSPGLYDALRKVSPYNGVHPFVATMDKPFIDVDMQTCLSHAALGKRVVLSGDYSHYDASLPPWFISEAGKIIGSWISGGSIWVPAMIDSMVYNCTQVTPYKIYEGQPSSMKSGSGGTNLLDSICNLLVVMYGHHAGAWRIQNVAIQGDDLILDLQFARCYVRTPCRRLADPKCRHPR